MGKKKREDERQQQGNGRDYEYLLVGEEEKTLASVVKSANCHQASFKRQLCWTTQRSDLVNYGKYLLYELSFPEL